jgi:hypothetical protein
MVLAVQQRREDLVRRLTAKQTFANQKISTVITPIAKSKQAYIAGEFMPKANFHASPSLT